MRTSILLLCVLSLLAFSATAAPTLVRVSPSRGVSFDETTVQILGIDLLSTSVSCSTEPPTVPQCPARAFFGQREGRVLSVSWYRLVVLAPPQTAGTKVDVRVEFTNGTKLTLPDSFLYVDEAEPRREDYRMYLVPLRTGEVHGANGSLWRTDLVSHNADEEDVRILANDCDLPFRTPVCAHEFIPLRPAETLALQLAPGLAQFEGTFVYVPEARDEKVDLVMRVRDVSRDAEGFGTEVPVVPEEDFRTRIRLLDVPTDPRFRTLLRLYGDSEGAREVTVTVYPMTSSQVLSQRVVRLEEGQGLWDHQFFPFVAAYTRLDPMTDAVRASGYARVRIHIDSMVVPRADPPLLPPVWGFLSITNNVTQQVTTVTPSR